MKYTVYNPDNGRIYAQQEFATDAAAIEWTEQNFADCDVIPGAPLVARINSDCCRDGGLLGKCCEHTRAPLEKAKADLFAVLSARAPLERKIRDALVKRAQANKALSQAEAARKKHIKYKFKGDAPQVNASLYAAVEKAEQDLHKARQALMAHIDKEIINIRQRRNNVKGQQ